MRAEVRARNAELLAQSVRAQRAEIAEARAPVLAQAQARVDADIRSLEWHRAQAKRWAREHPDAADRLEEYQAAARAKSEPPP